MSRRKQSDSNTQLAILRETRAIRELEIEERRLSALDTVERTVATLESYGALNYVDPREWRTDAYGREAVPVSTTNDRRDGRNSPFVETEQDLALIRGMARLVTGTTCAGAGIVENLTNYVIGSGFKFSAATKKRKSAPPELVAAVQDVVDEFLDDNDWTGDLDRELFRRSVRDGEFFLSLYPTPAGHTLARVVEPEYVTGDGAPPLSDFELAEMGVRHAVNWTFGVCAADHDVNTVHGYSVRWDSLSCDFLPAVAVEHFRGFNVDRNIKRGLSDFYPAWQWLNRHEKVTKNTAEGAAIQAAIAFIRQHVAGTRKSDVESMRDSKADYTVSARTGSGGTRTDSYRHFEPGTILDTPKGMEHLAGPMGAERGEAFISVAAKILRMVGSRWAMPEYMISGDASNANFACHDSATELLTRRGWLKWDQLEYGDVAGTMNQATGEFEWQPIQEIHVHDYDGPMVRLKGTHNLDALVTPNHRMFAARMQSRRVGGRAGKAVRDGQKPFQFIRADELRHGHVLPFACKPKQGVIGEGVSLPPVVNKRFPEYGRELFLPMNPFLSFLGWWISEGHISNYQKKNFVGVSQTTKSEAECDSIDTAIKALPALRLRRCDRPNGMSIWSCCNKILGTWLAKNCGKGAYHKQLPDFIDDLPAEQQEIVLQALIAGDGADRESGSMTYFTVSRKLADQVQSLAIQCGYVSHLGKQMGSGVWPVTIKLAKRFLRVSERHISQVPYTGKVWCVTVGNGLIVTRRNGKSIIAGNSTKEAGTPFVGLVEARQAAMKGRFLRVIWRVIEIAAAAGRFQRFGNLGLYRAIERLIEVQCEPPTVVKADPVQETTRRQMLFQAGVLSKKDWQTQEGIDPELQSSIDARPVAGGDGMGASDGAQPDAGTGTGPDVQGTALNGAQVTSLVAVVAQVSAGTLPKDSAKAIIGAAFPLLRPDQLANIIDPVIAGSVAVDGGPRPMAGGAGNDTGDTGGETTGAYLGLKRSEWKNARKAITDILGEVARKETSVSAARVFLGGLGLAAAGIDKLLADAGDGKVDTELPESAAPVTQPTAADLWLSRVMEKAWGDE